nr:FAD-dependent oxidoreductase [Microvirga tunisiensis]
MKKGVSVTLCEKGEIAGEQSSRNWGWCRTQSRDPRELPLAMESLRLWGQMNELVGAETGFRRCGILSLSKTDDQLEKARALLEHAKLYQTDSRLVSPTEIRQLVPGSPRDWAGGVYSPSDGRAEPEIAAPAMAEGAQRLGGIVLTHCAVRGLETSGGTVSGVVTEKGRISCQAVVLAGGAWSSLMCDSLGLRLPQLKVLGNVMRTAPLQGGPEISTSGLGFGLRKRLDGGYTVAFGQSNEAQIVPDSFKYFFDFLPRFLTERDAIRLRLGHRFVAEWKQSRPWRMDEVSPFEKVRILDPKPLKRDLDAAQQSHCSLPGL